MRNPFLGMFFGAWFVFLLVSVVIEWKWKEGAWIPWSIWLTIVTVAPIAWHINDRRKRRKDI
jgi:hypothetical protein